MEIRSRFRDALPYFPAALQQPLSRIPAADAAEIQEIRLRVQKPMQVIRGTAAFTVLQDGSLHPDMQAGIPVTRQALDTCFQNICSHSLHSWQTAIRQGFLTIAGGCRAGICGTAVLQNGILDTVRTVSSINLRIASERIGCAEALCRILQNDLRTGGLLIAGPPASGKTTVLRDIARILGDTQKICILDARGEIAAVQNGIPQFSVGMQTDVFDGYPKAEGMEIAVRVMSPAIVICDEIGSEDEANILLESMHTGVQFIASAHAGSLSELQQRPQIRRLIQAGVFRTGVLLGSGAACGKMLAAERFRRDAE